MSNPQPIQHVVLDIEGTTCPVNFVSDVLFPYARQNLVPFLTRHQSEEPIRNLLEEVQTHLQQDPSPIAEALRSEAPGTVISLSTDAQANQGRETLHLATLCRYLDWLIQTDRKITPLKDLQGSIWEEGYRKGDLIAPLFVDVPRALQRWHSKGIKVSVYSSGSVHAQKLLYAHTQSGDYRQFFSQWFDTRTGAKNDPQSYRRIASLLETKTENTLFISDALAEIVAADQAGMEAIFSRRPGNPQQDPQQFQSVQSFDELDF